MKPRILLAAAVLALSACATSTSTTTASPQQSAINFTYNSYAALDQAILAADAAVKAGTLKGADAQHTLTAATTAKAALDAMLVALKASATAPTTAASGVSK